MALATLSIDIEARLAKLEADMSKAVRIAEKSAAKMEARFESMRNMASDLGKVLGGAFAGFSIGAVLSQSLEAIDALNDLKDATGASIENLSALEDVARRNGGTLDDVAGVLVKFNGVLKEADGKNGVSEALKAIGLSAQDLKRLDPAEALRQTAVALEQYADDGNKARIVQELFGKSVREAAPFLKDLAEQGRLNATVTTEQAQQAEAFNKQMAALRTNVSNVAREIASELVPALNTLFEKVNNDGFFALFGFDAEFKSKKELAAAADEVLKLNRRATVLKNGLESGFYGPQFQKELDETNEKLRLAKQRFNELDRQQKPGSAAGAGRGFVNPDLVRPSVSAPEPSQKEATTPSRKIERPEFVGPEIPESLTNALKLLESTDTEKIRDLNATLAELLTLPDSDAKFEAVLKIREELESFDPAAKAAAEASKQFEESLARLMGATPSAQLEATRADMLLLSKAFEEGRISVEQYEEAVTARLGTIGDEVAKTVDSMTVYAEEAQRNIQDALGDTIAKTLSGDFDNILDLWLNMLNRMVSEAIAADIMGALTGKGGGNTSSLIQGFLGLFKGGATASALGNAFGPGGRVTAFANGGVVNGATYFSDAKGGLNVMGEAGYEAILPLKRGRNGKLGVATEGGSSQTVINVQAGMTRNETLSAIQTAVGALEGRILRSLRNGGAYAQAARGGN